MDIPPRAGPDWFHLVAGHREGAQSPETDRQPAGAAYHDGGSASATLKDAKGNEVGSAWFTADSYSRAVWVEVYLSHLSPGFHGMHIHEKGNCTVGDPKTRSPRPAVT
nr:superoxide dismutase family protein [Amycolatopsis orientalis]